MEGTHYDPAPDGICPACGSVMLDLRNTAFNRDQIGDCYRYSDLDFMCKAKDKRMVEGAVVVADGEVARAPHLSWHPINQEPANVPPTPEA